MRKYVIVIAVFAIVVMNYSCNDSKTENSEESTSEIKKDENSLSFIKTKGTKLVDDKGKEIILKGTNLGNWLVPEGYMFKMEQVNSPRKIDELLYELVGPDSLQVFWKGFLDNYITHNDIKYLKSIGANHVRLPFHYKMFTDDLYMGERNAGFKYIDRLVD